MKVEKLTNETTKIISKPFISFLNYYIYVFCDLPRRQTDRIFMEYMLIDQMHLQKRNLTSIFNSNREIDVSMFHTFIPFVA